MTVCIAKDYTSQIPLQIEVTNEIYVVVIWVGVPQRSLKGADSSGRSASFCPFPFLPSSLLRYNGWNFSSNFTTMRKPLKSLCMLKIVGQKHGRRLRALTILHSYYRALDFLLAGFFCLFYVKVNRHLPFKSHYYQVIVTNDLTIPNRHTTSFIHSFIDYHAFADCLFRLQHYLRSLGKNRKKYKNSLRVYVNPYFFYLREDGYNLKIRMNSMAI